MRRLFYCIELAARLGVDYNVYVLPAILESILRKSWTGVKDLPEGKFSTIMQQ
jgi:hypothetical protein